MIQTFHYKRLKRHTVPSLSELLTVLPDADVINLSQAVSMTDDDYPVGYKKVTLVYKGHRYAVNVREWCPVSSQYVLELSVSPHYHVHDKHLLEDFYRFTKTLKQVTA